jgi:hypothetical protein
VVLQVTPRRVPAEAVGEIWMSLLVVTDVVETTQVPVEALVAQENAPADAEAQATNDGLAADPAAEQLVLVE